ncbi:MAG: heavy metal-responsive transcriptional regulator [Bryobacteraceae bacterium]
MATSAGLTVDTVRFYEKQGLLIKPSRTAGGFRVYSELDIDRLKFVSRAQALGFSLAEVRELLMLRDAGDETCVHVHDLLDRKLKQVHEKLAELRKLERHLTSAKARCDQAIARHCAGNCPVLDELARTAKEVQ